LNEELEIILDQDDKIKNFLNRKEKITGMMKKNQFQIEKSLDEFDDLNKNKNLSPTYHLSS